MAGPGFSVHICETRTGTVVFNEVPYLGVPDFSRVINGESNIKVQIPVGDMGVPDRTRLRSLVAEWRYSIAVCIGTSVMAIGPIMTWQFDHTSQTLALGAGSVWALLMRRLLIKSPVTLSSPLDVSATNDANYLGQTLATIARNIVSDSLGRGSTFQLPIDLPSAVAGSNDRNYVVYDLASVGQRLKDLTQVENGPDIDWDPYFSSSGVIRINMRIGTPTLQQFGLNLIWDDLSGITNLNVDRNGADMITSNFTRGNATERASQVAWTRDGSLTAIGWPELEQVDTTHQSVTDFTTLQSYANESVRFFKVPTETWHAEVITDVTPIAGTFKPGDRATFNVQGHPWIVPGQYPQRILGWSGANEQQRLSLLLDVTSGSI